MMSTLDSITAEPRKSVSETLVDSTAVATFDNVEMQTIDQVPPADHGGIEEAYAYAAAVQGEIAAGGAADIESGIPDENQNETSSSPAAAARRKAAPELQDQTNLLPVRQVITLFIALALAAFVALLDQTIVSTALPQIGADFNSGRQAEWIATSYLLTSTVVQPVYGRISDIFGRKSVLLFALGVFLLGSILCAVAQSMTQIAFRAITGFGGGGILTVGIIIISDVVSLRERGKYQGIFGAVGALSNSIGPVIGGAFTTNASWRDCFWLAVPLTAFSIVIVVFLLPLKRVKGNMTTKLKQVDYAGTVLSFIGTIGILLPLSWGGTSYAWNSAAVIAPFVVGGVAVVGYLLVEWKVAVYPNIPLTMFKNMNVTAVQATSFLTGCASYVQLYYLPQYFQVVRGFSSIRSGLQLLPLIVVQTVISTTSGMIISMTGKYRPSIYLGFVVWSIGLGLLSTLSPSSTVGEQVGYLILAGVGAGQTLQTTLIAAQAAVPRTEMAVITATRNFLRTLGGSFALAICQAILNNTVKTRLVQADFTSIVISTITSNPTTYSSLGLTPSELVTVQDAFTAGVQNVFRFCYPCTIISFFISVLMIKQYELKRTDEDALKSKAKEWAESHSKHRASKPQPSDTAPALQDHPSTSA